MGSRWQRVLAEVGRFLAVGGLATAVAFVLFNLLVHGFNTGHRALLADHVIIAYVVANTVGMVISYRGARNWAFRDRPPRQADGGRLAYVVINVATMSLPIGCLWVSRNLLGLDDPFSDNISANVVGLALGLGARFYLFRTFVFRRPVHLPHLSLPHHPHTNPHEVFDTPADGLPLSETTDRSTSGRAQPPAP
ncbi:putative flippase GtrA [Nocardioides ginsengisegetis]|uniref:Putative flippase GtrA n=1 Tax=Nocardioides ginsengisegetis TaxID=661491 RepID=A0A7W3IXA1_9ACTN|nr:GtrA family protein [Nocardioides ginsengisegetis]MBA8802306.1 putative flippase GtrA [Nocardioides ginsengisegetis]